jgi:hypothetical protein
VAAEQAVGMACLGAGGESICKHMCTYVPSSMCGSLWIAPVVTCTVSASAPPSTGRASGMELFCSVTAVLLLKWKFAE